MSGSDDPEGYYSIGDILYAPLCGGCNSLIGFGKLFHCCRACIKLYCDEKCWGPHRDMTNHILHSSWNMVVNPKINLQGTRNKRNGKYTVKKVSIDHGFD